METSPTTPRTTRPFQNPHPMSGRTGGPSQVKPSAAAARQRATDTGRLVAPRPAAATSDDGALAKVHSFLFRTPERGLITSAASIVVPYFAVTAFKSGLATAAVSTAIGVGAGALLGGVVLAGIFAWAHFKK